VTRAPEQSAAVIEACRKKSAVGAHTTEVKSTRARTTALSAITRPLLALAFRKDDMLAGEPAGRQPREQ
jgi:hypothetical protein